jgi:hypothetical protein
MGAAKAIATSMAAGLPLIPSLAGAAGAAFRRKPNESFGEAYTREMAGLGAMERQAKEELAPGVGTALQIATGLGTFPAVSKVPGLGKMIGARVAPDAARLAKTLAATKRIAGGAALAGAESAARQGMEEGQLNPSEAAGLAAGLGLVGESIVPAGRTLLRGAAQIPVVGQLGSQLVRGVTGPVQEVATQARRGLADYFGQRGPIGQRVAAAVEPTDITRIQRTVQSTIPTQGQTVEQMAQQASLAEQGRGAIESALTKTKQGVQSAKKAITKRVGRIETIGSEKAKRDAQALLDQAEQQGSEVIGTLRGVRNNADQTRETIRQIQLAEGKEGYDVVRQLGAPPEPDPEVYKAIISDPLLRRGYRNAINMVRQETKMANPAEAALKPLRSVTIGQKSFPEISLEMFDTMRRHVMDQAVVGKAGATGVTASQRRAALETINQVEDRFLQGYGSDEAAQALRGTRAQYRARFEQLEALRDGLSLGKAKAGATPGLTKPNRMDLDEMTRRVAGYSPEAQEAFKVGAAKWFDNLMQEGLTKDAMAAIQKATASEAGMRRLALAFGENTALQMSALAKAPNAIAAQATATEARAAGLATRAQQQGGQRVSRLQSEAERLGSQLAQQTEQVGRLKSTADLAKTGVAALEDFTKGRGFVSSMPQALGAAERGDVRGAMAGALQDRLRGLSPQDAMAKLMEYQQNPAAREMFGAELDQAIARLRPRPSAIPSLRTYLTGQTVGRQ